MVLKEKKIKLDESIKHNDEDITEITVKELSFAGRLRIQSKDKPDLSDMYKECMFPYGILESMNREETNKYQEQLLNAYIEVNSLSNTGEEINNKDSPSNKP